MDESLADNLVRMVHAMEVMGVDFQRMAKILGTSVDESQGGFAGQPYLWVEMWDPWT